MTNRDAIKKRKSVLLKGWAHLGSFCGEELWGKGKRRRYYSPEENRITKRWSACKSIN